MCLLGLPWRHFWDLNCHSFLFTYCWEVFSPSWFIMLRKCFCIEADKNNLILESISSSTAWWKVHICWCEPQRVVVQQTFSSGNSKIFFSLPWQVVQWLLMADGGKAHNVGQTTISQAPRFICHFPYFLPCSFTPAIKLVAYYWWSSCPTLKREWQVNRKV